jgi:hypothetical protein
LPFALILLIVIAAPYKALRVGLIQPTVSLCFLLPFAALMFQARDDSGVSVMRRFAGEAVSLRDLFACC